MGGLLFHHRVEHLLGRRLINAPATLDGTDLSTFAASVVEWYSLQDAIPLLAEFSQDDHPVEPADFSIVDDDTGRRFAIFLIENQDVCRWAFAVDDSDDPQVWIDITAEGDRDAGAASSWHDSRLTFSQFIFSRIWDFQQLPHRLLLCGESASDDQLLKIRSQMAALDSSYRGLSLTCKAVVRFGDRQKRLLIGQGARDSLYLIRSETVNQMHQICCILATVLRNRPRLAWPNSDPACLLESVWPFGLNRDGREAAGGSE